MKEKRIYRVKGYFINERLTFEELINKYPVADQNIQTQESAPKLIGLCGPFPDPLDNHVIRYETPVYYKSIGRGTFNENMVTL